MSNTLLIRFPIIVSVYIVNRMHKVERRMIKTNAIYITLATAWNSTYTIQIKLDLSKLKAERCSQGRSITHKPQ